jgi:hypothetical protein
MLAAFSASAVPSVAAAEPAFRLPPSLENWRAGDDRWFASTTAIGGTQLKAAAEVGYGRPFWRAVSLQASGMVTPTFAQTGAHLVGALPLAQLHLGWTAQSFFSRGTLPLEESYSADDVNQTNGRARYSNLEVLLVGRIPLRPFVLFVRDQVFWAPWLDEQTALPAVQHFTLRPPWANVLQAFPMWTLGEDAWLRVGLASEVIWPGGDSTVLVRLGPAFSADLTAHTDLWTFVSVPLMSPDDVGVRNEFFGGLVLRYRWATGERPPAFP